MPLQHELHLVGPVTFTWSVHVQIDEFEPVMPLQKELYLIGPFACVVPVKMRPFTFVVLIENYSVQTRWMFRIAGDAGGASRLSVFVPSNS